MQHINLVTTNDQPPQTQIHGSDNFNSIYQAASTLNEDRLQELIDQNIMLDEKANDGMLTVSAMLAMEKKYDAVLLLLKHGAEPAYAAYGAACINDISFAESLRKHHGACVYELAKGVTSKTYAAQLYDRYPGVLASLAFASIKSSNSAFISTQLEKLALLPVNPNGLLILDENYDSAQLAAMLMNGATLVEIAEKIEAIPDKSHNNCILHALHHPGASMHVDGLNYLLNMLPPLVDLRTQGRKALLASLAARGKTNTAFEVASHWRLPHLYDETIITNAIANGHLHLVTNDAEIHGKRNLVHNITKGLILSGDMHAYRHYYQRASRKFIDFITTDIDKLDIAWDYARALLTRYEYTASPLELRNAAKIYQHSGPVLKLALSNCVGARLENICARMDRNLCLHTFAFMNLDFLQTILDKIKKTASQEIHQLILDAIKINVLMHKYQFNFDQAQEFIDNHDLRSALMACIFKTLQAQIPRDVNVLILSNLTTLPAEDVRDMANKYCIHKAKQFFTECTNVRIPKAARADILNEISLANSRPSLAGIFRQAANQLESNNRLQPAAEMLASQARRLDSNILKDMLASP